MSLIYFPNKLDKEKIISSLELALRSLLWTYNDTTFPPWCDYLRLHIKIRYAEVKIAMLYINLKIRLFFIAFLFSKYISAFQSSLCWDQFPASPSSSRLVPPGRERDVLVFTDCRGKACTKGWQFKAVSSSPAGVSSANQQVLLISHAGRMMLQLANAVSCPQLPTGCV